MVVPFVALALACTAAVAAPPDRDWPMPRHDRTLANRSPLKGDMREAPRELWRIQTAVWSGDLEVVAGNGRQTIALERVVGDQPRTVTGRGARRRARQAEWQKRLLDVSGTGKLEEVPVHSYWGKLVPGRRGLQSVAWTSTWGDAPSNLQCFSYEGGLDHPKLEWETAPELVVYSPQTLIADVNGDGSNEVAVAAHYRIMLFEGATGRKIKELRYHNLRNYGYFGLFFEPGDKNAKFVNLSDFAGHYDVVSYDGWDLRVAFRRDIEGTQGGGIERHSKIIDNGPNPLEDIDGDGRAELVFNLFNDTGDGRWHVMAYEPLTGTVKLDLPGQYLCGISDVDGCGKPELLLRATPGKQTTGWSTLTVRKLRNRALATLATHRNASFATAAVTHLPPTADKSGGGRSETAAAGRIGPRGEPGFLVLRPGPDRRPSRLEAYVRQGAAFERAWTVQAPAGGTVGVRRVEGSDHGDSVPAGQAARVVVTATSPKQRAQVSAQGVSATVTRWAASAPVPPTPIVLSDGGRLRLVTDTSGDRIAAYDLPPDQTAPRLLWRRPGRGMGTGGGRAASGAIAGGDLDGDGRPEVAFAEEDARTGSAALVAVNLDGRPLWRHAFEGFNSDRPAWNNPGLTLWTPAHLTDPHRLDVYVNARRSSMHSDVSFALDGRTGKLLWSGDAVPIDGVPTWGFGGTLVACADMLGNGLDQLISLYPVCYYVVDGRNGRFVRTLDLASQKVLPGWAAYGVPVVTDFLGNGSRQVLVPSPYVYGLLTAEGKPVWSAATLPANGVTPQVSGAEVGDYDGDGKLEVARLFAPGMGAEEARLDFLDAATGQRKGAVMSGAELGLAGAVSVDVDGDGSDELLMQTAPRTLAAVSLRGGTPHVLWQASLPADPQTTIAVDITGKGAAQLVVGCADGSIVALGR